ncbi:MAG: S8 family serine peptidase, partial [Lachnospiraceae bacterium]|nr:S8 family serine peptidase [Lachnospiraceae bacterium]
MAVVDTGCDLNVISGRIADGTDMSVTDVNGHGTLMTEIIASQTTEKVKILPIKAFDDNGYSTVGQVYDAIMRAIDLGADVINLSMSGAGTSQMLTNAINKATEKGIIVVAAAGNDASDVEGFMPGNIDTAITVSATDRNEVFAEYSNFGEKLDYSAVGEIIKDQGTEDTSDDVYYNGTSIAAAFVSSYAACVKDNNPEADIIGTFDKYGKDLGEAGRDNYYGRGFLALENISFDVNKGENEDSSDDREKITENTDKKEDDIEDKKSDKKKEKEEKELKTAATTKISVNNAADLQNAFITANSGKTVVANLKANISIDTNMGFLLKNGNLTINGSYTKSDGTKGKRHININFPNYFLNQAYLMTATGTATDKSTLTVKNIVFDAKEQVSCAAGNAIVTTFQSPWLEGKKSTLNVENCNFQNINYGSGGGMNAIEAKGGNLNVKNVNITDNIVLMTGGVTAWEGTNAVTCENVTITGKNKKSVDQGIAISKKSIKGSSTGTVTNCKISNANYGVYSANDAPTLSGGNTLIINNVTATNCNCAGILLDNKSVSATITDADIYDCNNSTYGYGIWIKAGAKATLNPTNGTISIGKRTNGNTASTKTHPNRIGIYNESGTLIVKDDNTADDKKINICWNSDRGIENKGSATVNSANVYNNGILYTTFNGQTDNYKYNTADTCAGIRNVG